MRKRLLPWLCVLLSQAACGLALAQVTFEKPTLSLEAGDVQQLHLKSGDASSLRWTSSDPLPAAVYGKGYVSAIPPGTAKISAGGATCTVPVTEPKESL